MFVCLFVCLFACLFVCLLVCLFVCLSACLSVCLPVCLLSVVRHCQMLIYQSSLFVGCLLYCLLFILIVCLFLLVCSCFLSFICPFGIVYLCACMYQYVRVFVHLYVNIVLLYVCCSSQVWTIAVGYIILIVFFWYPQCSILTHLSFPVWLLLIVWSTGFISSKFYRLVTLTGALILSFSGYICLRYASNGSSSDSSEQTESEDSADCVQKVQRPPPITLRRKPRLITQWTVSFLHVDKDDIDGQKENIRSSRTYFAALLWAFVVVKLLQNLWLLLLLLPVVFVILLTYNLVVYFQVVEWVQNKWQDSDIKRCIDLFFEARQDVFLPAPVRGVLRLLTAADRQVSWTSKTFVLCV